jgi:hypothetical protein
MITEEVISQRIRCEDRFESWTACQDFLRPTGSVGMAPQILDQRPARSLMFATARKTTSVRMKAYIGLLNVVMRLRILSRPFRHHIGKTATHATLTKQSYSEVRLDVMLSTTEPGF